MTAAARTIGLVGLLALLAAAIVGPLGLLAQSTTGFGAITVLSNTHLVAPNNPDLQHNVPSLQVEADGQTLVADFKTHFESTGGLSRWGYATSEVFVEEKGTLTQYYQRGAVDFHRVGGTYALERRLIWDYFGGGVGGSEDLGVEPGTTNNNSGQTLGPWSHKVSNWAVGGTRTGFLQFFEAVGGVDSLGFPKTEARIDTNQPGTVHMAWAPTGVIRQYFQAGVFEFDPANPAAGVNMALLGDRLRDRLYPDKSEVAVFRGAAALVAGQAYAALVVERDRLATPTPISAPAPTTTPRPQLPSTTAELIVVGTSDAGIAVYDAGAWFKLDVNNSDLTTNLVHAVHADKDGNVWAGTDAGLFKLGRNGRGAGFRGANTRRRHRLGRHPRTCRARVVRHHMDGPSGSRRVELRRRQLMGQIQARQLEPAEHGRARHLRRRRNTRAGVVCHQQRRGSLRAVHRTPGRRRSRSRTPGSSATTSRR